VLAAAPPHLDPEAPLLDPEAPLLEVSDAAQQDPEDTVMEDGTAHPPAAAVDGIPPPMDAEDEMQLEPFQPEVGKKR